MEQPQCRRGAWSGQQCGKHRKICRARVDDIICEKRSADCSLPLTVSGPCIRTTAALRLLAHLCASRAVAPVVRKAASPTRATHRALAKPRPLASALRPQPQPQPQPREHSGGHAAAIWRRGGSSRRVASRAQLPLPGVLGAEHRVVAFAAAVAEEAAAHDARVRHGVVLVGHAVGLRQIVFGIRSCVFLFVLFLRVMQSLLMARVDVTNV